MKILISSYVFSPSIGGIETVSALLSPEFVKAGHEVILVTMTGEDDGKTYPYQVYRRPSFWKLLQLVRWCDIYFQSNISLRLAWPLLFVRRPWVIAHHIWIGTLFDNADWRGHLKRWLLRHGHSATISQSVADDIPVASTVVGNPYQADVFHPRDEIPRDRELAYLGRLVSDKGVDLIIRALVDLREQGISPRLTIIGSGSEEENLRQLATDLGVAGQVEFAGPCAPEKSSRLLNAHQILVVPSCWPEPFGIVAIEGIGCGCLVIASRGGGLPDAVGPCGITFEMGNQKELAKTLHRVLTQPELREGLLKHADEHLAQFKPAAVAGKYLDIFTRAVQSAQTF